MARGGTTTEPIEEIETRTRRFASVQCQSLKMTITIPWSSSSKSCKKRSATTSSAAHQLMMHAHENGEGRVWTGTQGSRGAQARTPDQPARTHQCKKLGPLGVRNRAARGMNDNSGAYPSVNRTSRHRVCSCRCKSPASPNSSA